MYAHFLIATDGSELADKAITQGLDLAKRVNARVTIVHVTEPWTATGGDYVMAFPVNEYEKAAAESAKKILEAAAAKAKAAGVQAETVHAKDQFPAEGIIETAKARGCDLIVMASHGRRGFMKLMLGSQANRVVAQSATPVLICR
jgi:nucleotide-binding universal stress UspA family protein